jgi:phosphoesterase RecJ-like protein
LFAALATDTGWFRFPSTRPVTFACAGELVRAGAQPAALFNVLYEQDTLPRMHLRGLVLSRIRTERGGRLAYTYIALDDFRETGAVPSDTEDLVNAALGIIGVEVAAILVEQSSGKFKISLRSRGTLDCSAVAATFGGGGHKAAAGAMLDGPLADARQRLLNVVVSAMS